MAGSVILAGARTPIGKLSGALGGFAATDLGGFAIKAALDRAGVSADQVDYVFMGQVLQAGAGQITARQAAVQRRHPHDRARHHRQQGVPVRPQHDLPRRPADPVGRRRDRGGRRHGVDDPGPVPAARRPRGLPPRRQVGRRLDDVRRAVLRLRPGGHGRRHREVRGLVPASSGPRRTTWRPSRTSGRPPPSRRAASPTRSSRSRCPSAGATRSSSTPTRVSVPAPRSSRWATCAPRSTRPATSPPATPRRSPTAGPP